MREIKFRAMGELKTMFQVTEIDFEKGIWSGKWVEGYRARAFNQSIKEHPIMQYTGLTDKNGKEIYEGDILGGIWEGGYIAWCDKCKSLQYFADYNGGCQKCSGDTFWPELVEDDGKLEVIGNIYKTPELLEVVATIE